MEDGLDLEVVVLAGRLVLLVLLVVVALIVAGSFSGVVAAAG